MPRFSGKQTDMGVPVTIDRDRYVEGDTSAILGGTVILGEKPGSTVFPIQVDADGYLKIYLDGNVTLQTEHEDGVVNGVSKGTLVMGDDGADLQNISVDINGYLQAAVVEGEYTDTKYQDGAAIGSPYGTVMMGSDGSNVYPVVIGNDGYLQITRVEAIFSNSVADVTLVATSTTQIVGALTTRLCTLISNKRTNTQIFRIGDSNVNASRGAELAPGESISIETNGAIYGYNPGATESILVLLREEDDNIEPPSPPVLTSPIDGAVIEDTSVTFQWESSVGATNYQIRVSVDPSVEDPLFHEDTTGATSKNYTDFPNDDTVYYWKVRAYNNVGWGNWSTIRSFTNGSGDDIPILTNGHVGYYDFSPREVKYFKFHAAISECAHPTQVGNTADGGEYRTVHLLIEKENIPTVDDFELTWELPPSQYDCNLEMWLPVKSPGTENLYWNYNTGAQAEYVQNKETTELRWYYIMLYNDGDESVNNQRLTVSYWN
jgi:hypothetical protein